MANLTLELNRLRWILERKGLDINAIDNIVAKAGQEIRATFKQHADAAMQSAIEAGVEKRSADFINELQMDMINMELTTQSGNMEFVEPPFPMLERLLQNAKPMKDGSGVYKVIPVGSSKGDRPKISTNIYDAWKQVNTERAENARKQYASVAPKQSKFRTATSKQDANTKWAIPAKTKDFSGEMRSINEDLSRTMEQVIREVIQSYEENF